MVTLLKLGSYKKYRYQKSSLFLQIRWLYNDEPVSGKDFLPSVSGSRQVLAIPAVLKSHGGGKITCSAENEVGKASCSAFLTVTGNILELVAFYSTYVIVKFCNYCNSYQLFFSYQQLPQLGLHPSPSPLKSPSLILLACNLALLSISDPHKKGSTPPQGKKGWQLLRSILSFPLDILGKIHLVYLGK